MEDIRQPAAQPRPRGAHLRCLLLGWTVLPPAWFWTAVVVGILLAPSVIASFSDLADKPAEVPFGQHLAAVGRAARRHVVQALLALAFLPYEAFFCLDAIVRTIGRMLITHRRLLEWNPSSDVDRALEQRDRTGLLASYRSMAIAPAIAAVAWVGLVVHGSRGVDGRRADPVAVGSLARHCLVDQPSARRGEAPG